MQSSEGAWLARKVKSYAQFPANGGIGAKGRDHVARAPRGNIQHEIRPAGGPGPGFAALAFGHHILLFIIEIGRQMPRVIFARRGAEGADMQPIPFAAMDHVQMLKARQRCLRRIQQIAQHGGIAGHIFNAGFAMWRAGRIDNMRNVRPRRDGARERCAIPKIGGDPGNARTRVAPGQANGREARVMLGGFHNAAGGSAAGADNQGDTGIGHNDFLRVG